MQFVEIIKLTFLKYFNGIRKPSLKSLYMVVFLLLSSEESLHPFGFDYQYELESTTQWEPAFSEWNNFPVHGVLFFRERWTQSKKIFFGRLLNRFGVTEKWRALITFHKKVVEFLWFQKMHEKTWNYYY